MVCLTDDVAARVDEANAAGDEATGIGNQKGSHAPISSGVTRLCIGERSTAEDIRSVETGDARGGASHQRAWGIAFTRDVLAAEPVGCASGCQLRVRPCKAPSRRNWR